MRYISKIYLLVFIFFSLLTFSCSEYEQALRSKDVEIRVRKADEYFSQKKYDKASELYRLCIQELKSTPRFEDMYFKYAMSLYNSASYYDASIYFNGFIASFANSVHVEECRFLNAKCYQKLSPRSVLDQANTLRAIDEFAAFIKRHPDSENVPYAEKSIKELQAKIERKDLEGAELYYKTGQFKAANVAFKELIKKYPGSEFAEKYYYSAILSSKQYADLSIISKQIERYSNTLHEIESFEFDYPQSLYLKDVLTLKTNINNSITKINSTHE